jgi:glycosyltransferase involved in cell wall biosynthesis
MRIAIVSPGFAPTIGGVETVVTQVSRELVALGCQVEVWTHQTTPGSAPVTSYDGVLVRRFPAAPQGRYPLAPQLWRHVARHANDVDVLHAHSYHSTASLGVIAARLDVPLVVSPHYHGVGHTLPARLMHLAYRPLGARLLRRARVVVAVSAAEQALLAVHFPPTAATTTVIHNGADTAAIRLGEPWEAEPPTLLVVGRLEPYKRVDRVIGAFGSGVAAGQLVVIGDGPDRPRLERLAGMSARASDVRFLGRLPTEEVVRWWRTARGVVTMSEHEAFGLIALEGAAGGGQVLLSDLDTHREVARLVGDAATLVGSDDELRHQIDRVLRVSNVGYRPVRGWTDVAVEHLALYERLVTT